MRAAHGDCGEARLPAHREGAGLLRRQGRYRQHPCARQQRRLARAAGPDARSRSSSTTRTSPWPRSTRRSPTTTTTGPRSRPSWPPKIRPTTTSSAARPSSSPSAPAGSGRPFPALHRHRRRRPRGEGAALRGVGRRCAASTRTPRRTSDRVHFARAAQEGRVLVSNDIDMKLIAETWYLEGRSFPGTRLVASLPLRDHEPGRLRGGLRGAGRAATSPSPATRSSTSSPSAESPDKASNSGPKPQYNPSSLPSAGALSKPKGRAAPQPAP